MIHAAYAETRRRGDRRLSTEHLLLAVLHDSKTVAAQALGVDLATAQDALEDLDRDALAAIGLDVHGLRLTGRPATGRRPPLTSAAREVLVRSTRISGRKTWPTAQYLLLALLACEPPDPAAALLAHLGVNRADVRTRLDQLA